MESRAAVDVELAEDVLAGVHLLQARDDFLGRRFQRQRRAGVLITVEDDGPGIPSEKVDSMLQRGVRGDERVHGHGIGLAIVQDIVKAYRGELFVERSDELGGARFVVRFSPSL